MICCVIISFIIASLLWPLRSLVARFRPNRVPPLMWQLADGPRDGQIDEPSANPTPKFSLAARAESFGYALSGLRFVIKNEHNARIHVAAAALVLVLGVTYRIAPADWSILVLSIISVWFAETINTAFEYVCDVVSPEKNEAVKHAKDIAAGAVLITAMGAVIIGTIVMLPYIMDGLNPMPYPAFVMNNLCAVR